MDNNLDIIYNRKYLVIVPSMSEDLYEGFQHSFHNTVLMKNNLDEVEKIAKFINRNNFGQLIFVDYQVEYEQLMEKLNDKHEIKFIFTKSLGGLSDKFLYNTFKNIYKLYQDKVVDSLGVLDKGLYEVLKKKKDKVKFITLDIPRKNNCRENKFKTIGVLNSDDVKTHSFYNELSAVKLVKYDTVKLYKFNKITKNFLKLFNIKYTKCTSLEDTMRDNIANLYINFTDNNILLFLESMDLGVPCIVGNNEFLDENLRSYLMVQSDDDINEIAKKIDLVQEHYDDIMQKYDCFRNEYSLRTKNLVEDFLDCDIDTLQNDEKDVLITVVVPVYNTAKYLEKALKSIINAVIDDTEILIINDGSTDNSEDIILKYQKKYPELIRYIKQENHGLGNVRNVGLKEAKGKYIASIDSDDTIDLRFFAEAMKYLREDVDVLVYDWETINEQGSYVTSAVDYIFDKKNLYEGLLYTTIMPSTCNKIIKKSLYEDLNLKFIEDKYEDLSANPFVLLTARTIKYIPKPYYKYYTRSNSIMRTNAGYSMINVIKLVNERLLQYKKYINVDIDEFKYYTFSWRIEEFIFNQLYTVKDEEMDEFIDYVINNLYDVIVSVFESKYYGEMVNKLKEDNKKYIQERNEAFKNKKLTEFIRKARKKKDYFVLTPVIIYYGDNNG